MTLSLRASALAAALLTIGALSAPAPASAEIELSIAAGAQAMLLGELPLGPEEIGVEDGAFRVHRLEIPAGSHAAYETGTGEVAVIFVERGAVLLDGAPFHAGQVVTLDGDEAIAFENVSEAEATLLISDVVGVQ